MDPAWRRLCAVRLAATGCLLVALGLLGGATVLVASPPEGIERPFVMVWYYLLLLVAVSLETAVLFWCCKAEVEYRRRSVEVSPALPTEAGGENEFVAVDIV